jgi:hypothetical protein
VLEEDGRRTNNCPIHPPKKNEALVQKIGGSNPSDISAERKGSRCAKDTPKISSELSHGWTANEGRHGEEAWRKERKEVMM